MIGFIFICSALYLTLVVSFVFALLQEGYGGKLMRSTVRKWGKFLLGLVALGLVVQILTVLS